MNNIKEENRMRESVQAGACPQSPGMKGQAKLRIAVPTSRPQDVVNYLDALVQLGALGEAGRSFDPSEYDGLLLPGGADVNPSRYGRDRITQETIDDDLDEVQFVKKQMHYLVQEEIHLCNNQLHVECNQLVKMVEALEWHSWVWE